MSNNYFKTITNIEDLKTAYKKLAMQYHPDRPTGDLKTMQAINSEYDIMFDRLKNIHKKTDSEGNSSTKFRFLWNGYR